MNHNDEIQQVELSLEEAKRIADFGEAIQRLENNADFRRVILEGYFTDEARRLTFLTADSNLDERASSAVWAGIRGIGELRSFLMTRRAMAEMARKEIADHQEMLAELHVADADSQEEL